MGVLRNLMIAKVITSFSQENFNRLTYFLPAGFPQAEYKYRLTSFIQSSFYLSNEGHNFIGD